MNKKIKNITLIVAFALMLYVTMAICLFKPDTAYSTSERRELAKAPLLSISTVFSGNFMDNFENYTADQFPFRDYLRSLKAFFAIKILNKADNNGIYKADGHISKIEYSINQQMTNYAAEKFNYLNKTYMKDKNMNIYLSVVPDKNYFLAEKNGYPCMDYVKFVEDFKAKTPYMHYIDILSLLTIDDYYTTDSHWKQENISNVAEFLAKEMGTDATAKYTVNELDNPFCGVYLGQYALPTEPDTIRYLTNSTLQNCIVTYYDTGMPQIGQMYNMEKAYGKDPYEMFLSGSSPLITIENPAANTHKELILFRDSFGSSIAPLLAQGYKKITIVDIRYIQSNFLGNYITFENQDVLFLYSTTLLNNSTALR